MKTFKMHCKKLIQKTIQPNGSAMLIFLVLAFVMIIVSGAIATAAIQQYKLANFRKFENIALQTAEAGINYYSWHLQSNPNDYTDGNGEICNPCGPYVHTYQDPLSQNTGTFSLLIYPPQEDEPAIIESTGRSAAKNLQKTIRVTLGKKPFCAFQLLANSNLDLDANSIFHGKIHSNGGIRMEGLAYNIVESARQTYYYSELDQTKDGVWTSNAVETAIFKTGKIFPALNIDFETITKSLANLYEQAFLQGKLLPDSANLGYKIVLKTDGTYDVYEVTEKSADCVVGETTTPTWNIANTNLIGTFEYPANGIIFSQDDLWISGQINGQKITIIAASFPAIPGNYKNIILTDDLIYSNYDSQDTIGLIAQNNVIISLQSADILDIHAALISQNGKFYRPDYNQSCDGVNYQKNIVNLYGSLAENQQHILKYNNSGYQNFNFYFDKNLIKSPPPYFPLTGQNMVLNWEIISTN